MTKPEIEASYRAMAADEEREAEAMEWAEGTRHELCESGPSPVAGGSRIIMSVTSQYQEQPPTIVDQHLKDALKAAFIEVLQERPDLIRDVLEGTLEDIALARAIEEGDGSGNASREEVFALLQGAA